MAYRILAARWHSLRRSLLGYVIGLLGHDLVYSPYDGAADRMDVASRSSALYLGADRAETIFWILLCVLCTIFGAGMGSWVCHSLNEVARQVSAWWNM